MWINVGFVHIPSKEDIPQTSSMGSRLGFMLKPRNLFEQTPDSLATGGYVFTRNVIYYISCLLLSSKTGQIHLGQSEVMSHWQFMT